MNTLNNISSLNQFNGVNLSITYACYLAISVIMAVWVGQTLHKHGRRFLVDALHGNESLADSINHLLLVGFYLINFGYIALMIKAGVPQTVEIGINQIIELVSTKTGFVMLALGVIHLFNLWVLTQVRKSSLIHQAPPPVAPTMNITR